MSGDVIQSFLVSLGYKVDVGSERKLVDGIKSASKEIAGFALALEAMAAAAVLAVAKVAENFDRLYFASQRTGASADNIRAFGYAIGQLGGSAGGAQGAIEGFAKALRTNPGNVSLLQHLGVQTKDANGKLRDSVDLLQDLGTIFQRNGPGKHYVNAQYGAALGLDEETVRLLESGKLKSLIDQARENARSVGLNSDEAAKRANDFMTSLRELQLTISNVGIKIAADLMPQLTAVVDKIREWIQAHPDQIREFLDKAGHAAFALADGFMAVLKFLAPVAAAFTSVAESLTGKTGLNAAMEALGAVLAVVVIARLASALRLLTLLGAMSPPAWLLALLGVSAAASASTSMNKGGLSAGVDPITGDAPGDQIGGGLIKPGEEGGLRRRISRALGSLKRAIGFKVEDDAKKQPDGSSGSNPDAANPDASKRLGDAIAGTESGKAGYDAVLGNGAYGTPEKPISQMTLAEARDFGRKVRSAHGSSSALGRYQIVNTTRDAAQKALGLSDDTVYSAAVQNRMMRWIARHQGLDAWEGLKSNPRARGRAQQALDEGGAQDAPPKPTPLAQPATSNAPQPQIKMPDGIVQPKPLTTSGRVLKNPGPYQDTMLAALMRGESLSSNAPALTPSAINSTTNTNHVPITSTTTIHIDAAGLPANDIAGAAGRVQDGVNGRLQRSVQGAVR